MLKDKKIGFIGAGIMGEALIRGLIKSQIIRRENITASDINKDRLKSLAEELGIRAAEDNQEAARESEIIILAVKPKDMEGVLREVQPAVDREKLVISIAAGIDTEFIETLLPIDCPVVRVMPNTPCLVSEGMSAICRGKNARPEDLEMAKAIFSVVGKVTEVSEGLMDAVTGLSGSGPAYVYIFVESLVEAGVREGLGREEANLLAAQTVLGAAKMIMETGKSPSELKNMVTSPGGTTVAGLYALEKSGFRAAVMKAVHAATKRAKELAGK